ncbi:hypothetical protein ACIHDR_47670 [Nocardia sp. NPDC052278]|uniref:hypothetical protein n=1 Tax=unclassified Nocardia TaxID=2637762 RepID=UPI0036A19E76
MTETIELYVIARLKDDAAVADLYACEVFYDAENGTEAGRAVQGWWESVQAATVSPTLDAVDAALTAHGYRRTSAWRKQVTASGAVRYFTNATIGIENI